MPGSHFRIDQPSNPIPTGTTDVARTDLRQAVINLVGDNSTGQNNPIWTIVSFPPGSAGAQPSNNHTFNASFVPDVPGSYLLTFSVNGGGGINTKQFVVAVTFDVNGLVVDDGIREPALGETTGDDNSGGNQRSWAAAYEAGMARYMPAVTNVVTLRNRVSNRQRHVELLGYRTAGDGGGGLFVWDPASTAADDTGTVFQPTGLATGRWRRNFSGPVSSAWFGMKPDLVALTDVSVTGTAFHSASATLTVADQGKSVVVEGAKTRPLTGTVATTSGKRLVTGTSTKFFSELWEGAPITVNGVQHTVSFAISGTVATNGTDTIVGAGTHFQDELHVGQEVHISETAAGNDFDRKYLVSSITSQTILVLDRIAPDTVSGLAFRIVEIDDTHVLLDSNAGSTVSGLTAYGSANPLVTTIATVSSATDAVLAAAADIAVTSARAWYGTDNAPLITKALDHGEVEVPAGSYLLATRWTVTQQYSHAKLLPGASLYVADGIFMGASGAQITGPGRGLAQGTDVAQVFHVGNTSLRDFAVCIAGTNAHGNENMALKGVMIDRHSLGDNTGATGLIIGRIGDNPVAYLNLEDVNVIDFQNGIDAGGMQTSQWYDVYVFYRFETGVGKCTGDAVRWAAYADSRDGGSAQQSLETGYWKGGLVGGYRRHMVIGGYFSTGGAVQDQTIENVYFGGHNPESQDIQVLFRQTFNVTLLHCPIYYSAPARFAIQFGCPSGSSGLQGRCSNIRIFNNDIGIHEADFVGYAWSGITIGHNSHGVNKNVFRNYGNGYFRLRGVWFQPSQVAYTAGTATDVDDPTGFSFLDQQNFSGGGPAPTTTYPSGTTLHAATNAGTTNYTGTHQIASAAILTILSGGFLTFVTGSRVSGNMVWPDGQDPTLSIEDTTGATHPITVLGQNATSGDNHGGNLVIRTGDGHGTQTAGQLQVYHGASASQISAMQAVTIGRNEAGTLQTIDFGAVVDATNLQASGSRYIINMGGTGRIELDYQFAERMRVDSGGLYFFGGSGGVGRQTITGSYGGGTVLASVVAALVALGLATDGTSP
jgi:hypothetical protein